MYVQNLDTGLRVEMEVEEKESRVYNGHVLQFIGAERSEELANFHSVTLYGNEGLVDGEGWTSLGSLGHLIAARMQETNKEEQPVGQIMASTSGLAAVKEGPAFTHGIDFTSTWHRCHR